MKLPILTALIAALAAGCAHTPKPFVDTDKPNAIYAVATADPLMDTWPFSESDFKKIEKHYDIRAVKLRSDTDLYTALTSTPNVELLVINAHANNQGMHMGSGEGQDKILTKPLSYEHQDLWLLHALDNLHPNARIFLKGCSTGEGDNSFAKYFSEEAKGRRVFGATENMLQGWFGTKIINMYPFEVKVYNHLHKRIMGNDSTYDSWSDTDE